jgi:DASS family divalent anion:Na+ symporter
MGFERVPAAIACTIGLLIRFVISAPAGVSPNAWHLLVERGPLNRGEQIMLGVFAMLLLLWAGVPAMVFGNAWAVDATTTAFIGLGVLLLTGVLDWEDVLQEKSAWDTTVWFSALVMMATFLNKLGLIGWFSTSIKHGIDGLGLGWVAASALLLQACLYAHYLFAGTTAHITAMFAAFYGAGIALGAPPLPFALLMAAASTIMMTLTHYATGTSPVIFGSGYTTLGEWWQAGFVMSLVLIAVWVMVGGSWWMPLGYW